LLRIGVVIIIDPIYYTARQ